MMRNRLEITGQALIRNGLLNIAGQGLPFLFGLLSMPVVVHGLGAERLGLLIFTWTLLGVLGIADLGLGPAVTKHVAEALGRGDHGAIPGILWWAALGQVVLGGMAALLLASGAGMLVREMLHVSPALHEEATGAFRLAALTFPIVLVSTSFRSALEAAQRFDVAAAYKAASGSATFLIPMLGTLVSTDLVGIMAALLVARLLLLAVLVRVAVRSLPARPTRHAMHAAILPRLLVFGGWVTISGLAGLVLTYTDRFIIGGRLAMSALAYYSVPQEMIARLTVISASAVAVLFPAFSALGGAGDLGGLQRLFYRSAKYMVLTVLPAFGLIAVVAPDILRVWLGPDLAGRSAAVLRILAVGAGVQTLGVIPYTLLQGLGRSDLTAKIHLIEAPAYVAVLAILVGAAGIVGAAAAWSGRMVIETILLYLAAGRIRGGLGDAPRDARCMAGGAIVLCGASAVVYVLPLPVAQRAVLLTIVVVLFGRWVWRVALDAEEREGIARMIAAWRSAWPRPR
ncbi:MAG: flippase [Armatimonadota bacterium]|nr:flippase [Armatimonadota bacterium]